MSPPRLPAALRPPTELSTFSDEFGWATRGVGQQAGRRTDVASAKGSGFAEYHCLNEDMYLVLGECSFRADEATCYLGDGLMKVHVQLDGNTTIRLPNGHRTIICAGNWGILVHPLGAEKGEWLARRQRNAFVTLYCRPSAVAEMVGQHLQVDAVSEFAHAARPSCTWVSLPPEPAVAVAAREMLHCQYQAALRHHFLEARAMELLCRAIGAISPTGDISNNQAHRKRLAESRAILLERWIEPPTIEELARMVGMNRRALICGFKASFGTTIFEFIIQQRMAHARILLRDTSLTIAEIAHRVGYSQPNSFSAAFRRVFHESPRDLRS